MQVKRYTGETIQDAIFKVKADLGPEAVIIDRRKYKEGGIFGFFAKTKVEVLATIEVKTEAEKPEEINAIKEFINDVKTEDKDFNSQNQTQNKADFNSKEAAQENYTNNESKQTKQRKFDLKSKLEQESVEAKKTARENLSKKIKSVKKSNNQISKADDNIYNYLLAQGVESRFITKFIRELENEEDFTAETSLKEKLPKFCNKYFDSDSGIKLNSKQKVVSFIGPTGVGKTTTIAKVAAIFSVEQNKKVGLITADTYRIAAVEQLQTYSDIIDLPFAVSYSGDKLQDLIENRFNDCDLVLIDTPGSSWKDQLQLGRLKMYTEADFIDETHLVVSMNTKSSDLKRIIDKFGTLYPDHMLLTKLDETESYGDLINLKENYGLPFSFLSFGQDVPEDIEAAEADNLRKYLFGDYYA
ncbi:MAG: flagellar biosynthesis protein FlhF [Bacillota bacterium]